MAPFVRRLGKQIARQLRDEIAGGRFREGEPLREIELSKRFGTSRGPIRDALLELTKEGMLVAQRSGGVAVAPPPADDIKRLITPIRQTIETYALAKIFDSLTGADFDRWRTVVDQMYLGCKRRDLEAVAEADVAFHRSILERADDHCLTAIWSTIVGQLRRHFAEACLAYPDLLEYHAEHLALVEAFRSGNQSRAVRALEEHIRWPIRAEQKSPAPRRKKRSAAK